METIDYNGPGRWSRAELLARYAHYAKELKITPCNLTPLEFTSNGTCWIYPVMEKVIEGIRAGDPACVRLGVEFIEEDAKFPFGKILKSNAARALRRATLSEDQKHRIRRRVFGLLRDGHVPREYRDYARLVRAIGFDANEIPEVDDNNEYAVRFRDYFRDSARRMP